MKKIAILAIVSLFVLCGTGVWGQETTKQKAFRLLDEQAKEFRKEVIRVTDNVYHAVGFDGSNAAMIVGTDGVVIVDTLRATGAAEAVLKEFRRITDKPVKAIIYTHSHEDHTGGAAVFAGQDKPDIYARENFGRDGDEGSPVTGIIMRRGARMFGRDLPDKDITIRGVAPGKTPTGGAGKGKVPPNKFLSAERTTITVAGVTLELVTAPGETDDQLYVWYPEKKVLFCGDNYYRAFPNLYTIRGTMYRDVRVWAASLDKMSKEGAEYLVTGHTRPVFGKAEVKESIENYRDAIRSVFDQTVQGINRGLTPDELADTVKLPPHLASKPFLQEMYGTVPFAVRAIFAGYLGWFDGNPTNLYLLSPKAEAQRVADLAGGEENLMSRLRKSAEQSDWQWVCRLADYIMALNGNSVAEARQLKAKALRELGENQSNPPSRNYYLSSSIELEKQAAMGK
jgi:alkyl sulfatase BDS1-like metallo-beta-lactamase superfamily hydrolase